MQIFERIHRRAGHRDSELYHRRKGDGSSGGEKVRGVKIYLSYIWK